MNAARMHASRAGTRVLVSDIGGTNARFALADGAFAGLICIDTVREYPVAAFASLADAGRQYLDEQGAVVDSAVFAVAGRVVDGEVQVTNHAWTITSEEVRRELGLQRVWLLNDFAAQAMAITRLGPDDVVAIGPGTLKPFDACQPRTYAVIGPGTGLGVGGLMVRDGRCHPLETEGGHAGFAPGTAAELRLLECLARRFGRVSCERLVSGPGLTNLHAAVLEVHGETPQLLAPSQITSRAAAGDTRCSEAIEMFCSAFGSMAGDLVLMHGAWDGVFLSGGLVPKMLGALQASPFRARFEDKGRFAASVSQVPCFAVVHPQAGLLGAAAHAAQSTMA